MIDRSPPPPGTGPRGTLLPRTVGPRQLDLSHLADVFGEQRQRFVSILRGFGPYDWAAIRRQGLRICRCGSCMWRQSIRCWQTPAA